MSIEEECRDHQITYHQMENNVRAKRNWGITHASYPVVLFIDSDCQASPGLLKEYARTITEVNSKMLGGVVGLTRFTGSENWVWKLIQRGTTLSPFSFAEENDRVPWGPTCNICYKREVIEKIGMFDTSFPFALGGDDTDLGVRVTDSGYFLATNRNAVVYHEKSTWSSLSLIGKRLFRWGRMHYYMMRKHSHRVVVNPPAILPVLILLMLLFLPFGFIPGLRIWTTFPFLWFGLVVLIDAGLVSWGAGKQPVEYFLTIGARLLGLLFPAGTLVEGLRHSDLSPFLKDVSYSPNSPRGRKRGISQMWAIVLAFPLSFLVLSLVTLLWRT